MRQFAAVFLLTLGCGAPAAPSDPVDASTTGEADNRAAALAAADAICDGSDQIRFGIASVGGGPLSDADYFYAQNGHYRVAVDGKCRIWTNGLEGFGPSYLRGRLHRGELTRDELADLLQAAKWDRWKWLSELNLYEACNDTGGYMLVNEEGLLHTPACIEESAPDGARETADAISLTLGAAAEQGQDDPVVEGDMRYRVVPQPWEGELDFVLDWPGEMGALSSALGAENWVGCPGTTSIATGKQADVLRSLRDDFIAEATTRSLSQLFVTDGAETYRFFLRDVGPDEDADGKAAFPNMQGEACDSYPR